MNTTIKVSGEIREVTTLSKNIQVTEGILKIIPQGKHLTTHWFYDEDEQAVMPVIISETEEVEMGDIILVNDAHLYYYNPHQHPNNAPFPSMAIIQKEDKKVLALPDDFTKKHLNAIVAGKIKEGDKVLVECTNYIPQGGIDATNAHHPERIIKHPLTIHKAEQSWDDIRAAYQSYKSKTLAEPQGASNLHLFEYWLEENYETPKSLIR